MDPLKIQDIIIQLECISDVKISKSDLMSPSRDLVINIYTTFLRDFGMNIDIFDQVPMNAPLTVQENFDMYKNALFYGRLANTIKEFMSKLNSEIEFTINDIINPNSLRTRKFLTLFINFYQYVFDNLPIFQEIGNEIDEKKKKRDYAISRIQAMNIEIERNRQNRHAECKIELNQVKEEIEEAALKIKEEQDKMNRLKGRNEGLKSSILELHSENLNSEQTILKKKKEVEVIRNKVATSGEIEYYHKRLQDIEDGKDNNKELRRRNEDKSHEIKAMEENRKFFKELLTITDEIIKEQEKLENSKEELDKAESNFSNKQKELENRKIMREENNKKLESLQSQLNNLKQERKKIVEGIKAEIEVKRNALSILRKNKEEETEEIKKLKEEISYIQDKINNDKKGFQEFIAALNFSHKKIMEDTIAYVNGNDKDNEIIGHNSEEELD